MKSNDNGISKYLLVLWNQDSSIITVTRLWAGWLGFNSWQGAGIFLFATMGIKDSFPRDKVTRVWSWLLICI